LIHLEGRLVSMAFSCESIDLPLIDFALLSLKSVRDGDQQQQEVESQRELEKLREACQELGFFRVINHGFDSTLMQTVDYLARDMFTLPADIKERAVSPIFYSGYAPPKTGPQGKDSMPESMFFPDEHSTDDIASKLWPQGNQIFCDKMHEYSSKIMDLSHGILKHVLGSLGLDVNQHYPSPSFENTQGWMRMNFYHNKNASVEQEQFFSKAHTDNSCITILYQDDIGGLQVRTKKGEWINSEPLPGSFVVIIGDCFQMWSNGRYRSAEHRVVYGGSKKNRLSIVFLLDFMDKMEICSPPELIDEKHPQMYRAVTFEDLKAYYKKAGPSMGGPPPYFLLETDSHKGNSVEIP